MGLASSHLTADAQNSSAPLEAPRYSPSADDMTASQQLKEEMASAARRKSSSSDAARNHTRMRKSTIRKPRLPSPVASTTSSHAYKRPRKPKRVESFALENLQALIDRQDSMPLPSPRQRDIQHSPPASLLPGRTLSSSVASTVIVPNSQPEPAPSNGLAATTSFRKFGLVSPTTTHSPSAAGSLRGTRTVSNGKRKKTTDDGVSIFDLEHSSPCVKQQDIMDDDELRTRKSGRLCARRVLPGQHLGVPPVDKPEVEESQVEESQIEKMHEEEPQLEESRPQPAEARTKEAQVKKPRGILKNWKKNVQLQREASQVEEPRLAEPQQQPQVEPEEAQPEEAPPEEAQPRRRRSTLRKPMAKKTPQPEESQVQSETLQPEDAQPKESQPEVEEPQPKRLQSISKKTRTKKVHQDAASATPTSRDRSAVIEKTGMSTEITNESNGLPEPTPGHLKASTGKTNCSPILGDAVQMSPDDNTQSDRMSGRKVIATLAASAKVRHREKTAERYDWVAPVRNVYEPARQEEPTYGENNNNNNNNNNEDDHGGDIESSVPQQVSADEDDASHNQDVKLPEPSTTKKKKKSQKALATRQSDENYQSSSGLSDPDLSLTAVSKALGTIRELHDPPIVQSHGEFTADEEELIRRAILAYQKDQGIGIAEVVNIIQFTHPVPGMPGVKKEVADYFWYDLEQAIPSRNLKDLKSFIRSRYHIYKRGPWTEKENERLVGLYEQFPQKWKWISQIMRDRSSRNIYDHWRYRLQHSESHDTGRWTHDEEVLLLRALITVVQRDKDHRAATGQPPLPKYECKDIEWSQVCAELDIKRFPQQCANKWRHMQKRDERPLFGEARTPNPDADDEPLLQQKNTPSKDRTRTLSHTPKTPTTSHLTFRTSNLKQMRLGDKFDLVEAIAIQVPANEQDIDWHKITTSMKTKWPLQTLQTAFKHLVNKVPDQGSIADTTMQLLRNLAEQHSAEQLSQHYDPLQQQSAAAVDDDDDDDDDAIALTLEAETPSLPKDSKNKRKRRDTINDSASSNMLSATKKTKKSARRTLGTLLHGQKSTPIQFKSLEFVTGSDDDDDDDDEAAGG